MENEHREKPQNWLKEASKRKNSESPIGPFLLKEANERIATLREEMQKYSKKVMFGYGVGLVERTMMGRKITAFERKLGKLEGEPVQKSSQNFDPSENSPVNFGKDKIMDSLMARRSENSPLTHRNGNAKDSWSKETWKPKY